MIDLFAANAASALVSAIWQGTILAVCVTLCLRLLPGIPAAFRSFIWSAVFCAVCALHFLPSSHGNAGINHPLHLASQWSLAVLAAWLGCSLFRAIQLAAGLRDLRQVLRRATPIPLHLGAPDASRAYQVCESPDVDRPSVLGFFSPRILLPPGLVEALTPAELNQVLLHEVEHLRRSDDWTNLAQRLALIFFPLNPVLLWIESRMCLERELACDDAVVATTGARKAYALCLTQLAERTIVQRGVALALGAWERRSELAHRVHRILRRPVRHMHPTALRATAATLVCAVALGSLTLARSPQLVTFVPSAGPAQLAGFAPQSVPYKPEAVFTNAAMRTTDHPAALVSATRVSMATRPAHSRMRRKKGIHRNTFPFSATAQRSERTAVQPAMLLTISPGEATPQFYVPAVIRMPVAYAAVATADGWIIIQL